MGDEQSTRRYTHTCREYSCMENTREGKPYCSTHVYSHEYVQEILSNLAAVEDEVVSIMKNGVKGADPRGRLADEVMTRLVHHHSGAATVDRLSRDIQQDKKVVAALCMSMAREQILLLSKTSRGSITVKVYGGSNQKEGEA